jgi:hypothetical protein
MPKRILKPVSSLVIQCMANSEEKVSDIDAQLLTRQYVSFPSKSSKLHELPLPMCQTNIAVIVFIYSRQIHYTNIRILPFS